MIASAVRESKPLPQHVTGLDIGGAHLKLAEIDAAGRVVRAVQLPCQLWLGLDRLERALDEITRGAAPIDRLAVTMTGELADLFSDRTTGVVRLVETVAARFPGASLALWAGHSGFVAAGEAAVAAGAIASANWLATAALAARAVGEGVLVDLGSTTADILLLAGGEVRAQGLSDRERLASGELVYTGLTRTPLMAVARLAPLAGRWHGLMHEHFATMADVYRVLRLLPEAADQHPPADQGGKTVEDSMRRLARMLGADLADATAEARLTRRGTIRKSELTSQFRFAARPAVPPHRPCSARRIPMAGRQKSDEKRDEILAAAEQEFARREFHQVLMDDVAARAGVGKGTLYRYFPTKEELFLAMVLRGLDESHGEFLRAFDDESASLETILETSVGHMLSYFRGREPLLALLQRHEDKLPQSDTELWRQRRDEACIGSDFAVFYRHIEIFAN